MILELVTVPLWWQIAVVFLFGVIIGSFLNVVIYRLHTGKSLAGRSHCLSCGQVLAWSDLLPLVSFLLLRGRCRYCTARVTGRYFAVELLTGLLFVSVLFVTQNSIEVAYWWVVMSLLVVVLVYDLLHLIIPDRLVVYLLVLSVGWAGYGYFYLAQTAQAIFYDLGAAVLGAGALAFLWYISQGRWIGLGDAKLALPLGLFLGAGSVFSLHVLSFWIGAVVSVGILLVQTLARRGQPHLRFFAQPLTIKSEVPFAPFLIIAFLFVYWFEIDVLALTAQWFLVL